MITSNRGNILKANEDALYSQQEKADNNIFLATQFAFDLGFERVNIITIDTDVALLALYYQSILKGRIFLEYGTSANIF